MSEPLTFPPLMSGQETTGSAMDHAQMRAITGCDAGLIAYNLGAHEIQAALVFAPEVPLRQAMTMLPLCGIGFQNALGALAPPEVAVHLQWDGGLRVNGAKCGRFQVTASDHDPTQVPDWLIVGLTLPLLPPSDDTGHQPDETALMAEGCADVSPPALIEAWARHTLNWITRWEAEGNRALHADWRGLAHGMGQAHTQGDQSGTFLGVDEDFGMLLRQGDDTRLIPLTTLLEDTP
jgi:biotin-(acetyl-CoA carboxylase) ligase